jgi:hypothetical protein
MARDVLGQRIDRGVAIGRPLLQRLVEDRVKIAAQRFSRQCIVGRVARLGRIDTGDRLLQLRRAAAPEPVRSGPGQQFIRDHAQAVDIAGGADRLALNLLRTGVVQRQRATCQLGKLRLLRAVALHQLGDTEVEQPHLAVGGDENVAGLQVPMHDEPAVREGDRAADLQQQIELAPHRQRPFLGVGVDRLALDVLQRQVRPAVLVDPGVVQARDVRVLQAGEDVALARHAFGQATAPRQARELQRNLTLEAAVGPLGQPHRAHATKPQFADQAIGTDRLVGGQLGQRAGGTVEHARHARQGGEELVGLHPAGLRQQRAQGVAVLRVLAVELLDEGVARGGIERERFIEQCTDDRPSGSVERQRHDVLQCNWA